MNLTVLNGFFFVRRAFVKGLVEWRTFFKITWVLAFEVIIQNHYFIASFFPFFSPPVIKNIHHTTTHNFRVCAWRKCLETLLYFLELEELVKCWGIKLQTKGEGVRNLPKMCDVILWKPSLDIFVKHKSWNC